MKHVFDEYDINFQKKMNMIFTLSYFSIFFVMLQWSGG
jgi:hypothetical protein